MRLLLAFACLAAAVAALIAGLPPEFAFLAVGGGTYTYSQSNVALSTTADWATFISAASRRARFVEVAFGGQGTASAANSILVQLSTGGTTGGGALTGGKQNTDLPTAAETVNTTWAAQPSLTAGRIFLTLPVNANGGLYRWVARPGIQECEYRNAEQISVRSNNGTSNVTGHVSVQEDF